MKWTSVCPLLRMSCLVSGLVALALLPAPVLGNPQPVDGACCLVGGDCQVLSAYDCQQAGGMYQGDFSTCAPNPCLPVGACCFATGQCEILAQAACVELWGGWMGEGFTTCVPNPCPDCLLPCSSDACCLPDGSCRLTYASTCQAHEGIWQGYGLACVPDPCVTSSAPDPTPMYEIRTWGQVKSIYR